MAEEEIEYESDPEEAKLSLKLRPREVSDDEAEAEGGGVRAKPPRRIEIDDSNDESEDAAADYGDEFDEEYDLDEEYAEEIEEVEEEAGDADDERMGEGEVKEEKTRVNNGGSEENVGVEGEKKEMDPFVVPKAGAFYMHDDRFPDNAGGRNRRMFGGRKLWESKDDRKWGHDKFKELTMKETSYEEHRRVSRGRNRGCGRNRAADRGYAQENRTREPTNKGT